MLTWKAKGKRPNLTGQDHSPSSSYDEDEVDSGDESFKDEIGREVWSLTKGKGKSAMLQSVIALKAKFPLPELAVLICSHSPYQDPQA